MHRLAVFVFAVLAALVCPVQVSAQTDSARPRVLLIVDDPASPLIRRLSAEISELDVTLVTRASAQALDTAARAEGAIAAIRVVPAKNGVEVWMADATSGRSLLRQVIVDESPGGPNYNNVALQTAELLRTSLLYAEKPEPEPAPAPPPPEVRAEPPPESKEEHRGEAGVQAGAGVLYSPGGVSTAVQAWVALHYPVQPWLAAGLEFGFPLDRGTVSGPEGTARVGCYLAAATLSLRWQRPDTRWFAGAGLGGGLLRVTTEGEPVAPLAASEDAGLTGLVYLRADAGIGVTRWLRVGARTVAGFSIPPVRLDFAGNDAGTWGAPLLGALGLIEVPWS